MGPAPRAMNSRSRPSARPSGWSVRNGRCCRSALMVTKPGSRSTPRWRLTLGCDIPSAPARSPTDRWPSRSSLMMSRRFRSASARQTRVQFVDPGGIQSRHARSSRPRCPERDGEVRFMSRGRVRYIAVELVPGLGSAPGGAASSYRAWRVFLSPSCPSDACRGAIAAAGRVPIAVPSAWRGPVRAPVCWRLSQARAGTGRPRRCNC